MAIHINDRLAEIIEDDSHLLRHDIWLWLWLSMNGASLSANISAFGGMRNTMAAYLENNRWLIERVKAEKSRTLIPERELKWISEGNRQIEWLKLKAFILPQVNILTAPIEITGKDLLIAAIDLWQTDHSQKALELRKLEKQWHEHKLGDNRYKWFKDDQEKVTTAWNWLNSNVILGPYTSTTFESYEDLLIYFDRANFTPEKIDLYIEKIKRKWSQGKYRKSLKNKNQYNFILTDKAIGRLDKIASEHNISRARVIEILLEQEAEKNLYVPEKIRMIKLLNDL